MPTLRNINPIGAVDLPLIGRALDRNEEFDVTTEQAGRAPSVGCDACGKTHDTCHDPGAGLLAQVDNYELVTKKKG